jgi:histidinol-phosphatase
MAGMETDLALARRGALAGAAVGLEYFASLADLPQELKADGSVVTEADRAVEAAIRRVLTVARPGDAVLGEESGQTGEGGRRWIVDPIDGTALFVSGDDRWLVLVALEEDGEVVAGVAAVPAQGRIWWASRGDGGFEAAIRGADVTAERRIGVDRDGTDVMSRTRLGIIPTGDGLFPSERAMIAPLTDITTPLPWSAHAALLVAGGTLDLAVQTRGELWDYAATSLIVEEAGGHFGGLDGRRWPAHGPAVYARTEALHTATTRLLQPATGPGRR